MGISSDGHVTESRALSPVRLAALLGDGLANQSAGVSVEASQVSELRAPMVDLGIGLVAAPVPVQAGRRDTLIALSRETVAPALHLQTMRTVCGALVWLVVCALTLAAQGAIPPQHITWTQDVDPQTAQTFVYTLRIAEEGNPTPRVVGLLGILCSGQGTTSECSSTLPLAAQPAIITGNLYTLTATDPRTNQSSPASWPPSQGDQGCIFRDRLYAVGVPTQAQTNKQGLAATLAEFKRAKFKHVRTTDLKGNAYLVVEECVGYIVS
jgi:hypothetical protein